MDADEKRLLDQLDALRAQKVQNQVRAVADQSARGMDMVERIMLDTGLPGSRTHYKAFASRVLDIIGEYSIDKDDTEMRWAVWYLCFDLLAKYVGSGTAPIITPTLETDIEDIAARIASRLIDQLPQSNPIEALAEFNASGIGTLPPDGGVNLLNALCIRVVQLVKARFAPKTVTWQDMQEFRDEGTKEDA